MKKYNKLLILIIMAVLIVSLFLSRGLAQKQTLYWGSENRDVRTLQWKLQQWGYYNGVVDGRFGRETHEAVMSFQIKNRLRVDGIVGSETWEALGYKGTTSLPSFNTATAAGTYGIRDSDVQLLAHLVHAEAGAEPYEGQVAVAAVLLNRVEDPAFPNTISGVIYQPLAFESVSNGFFNTAPTQQNITAARAALNGWDPTYGALFFWNPSKPVNRWIWSRKTVRTIGEHIFAY